MPIYEFKCSNDHVTEHFCLVSKRPETVQCKECSKIAKRIFSSSHVKTTLDLSSESLQDRGKRYKKIVNDKKFGDR